MITMTEIAKLAGVSQPTVSRVLNGNPNVDPELRERVLACARAHDYQPNALAKGLQGSRTRLLGVLVTDISNGFFADLVKRIEMEARKHGYSILLFNSDYNPDNEQEYLSVVRRYRVDGALVVPIRETSAKWNGYVKRLDVPVITVTRRAEGLDSIYVDQAQAGAMVADYLAGRGYGRFLFIGRDCDGKYAGFRQALEAKGFGDRISNTVYQDGDRLRQTLREWFRSGWGRAAVFAGNDIYALRVLDALRSLGLSVPGNVGVIGFDDSDMGSCLNPRLTSVSQPLDEMARRAVERVLERVERPEPQEAAWDVPLSASLVIREST